MTLPDKKQVEALAAKLTKAQGEAVRNCPPSWFNLPSDHEQAVALRSTGLVRSYRHQFARRSSMSLDPVGLALRSHLLSEQSK